MLRKEAAQEMYLDTIFYLEGVLNSVNVHAKEEEVNKASHGGLAC